MIGIVIVSHSRALAEAAVGLTTELFGAGQVPTIEIAAGTADGSFGTNATAVGTAIEQADSGDGVLVLMDLGSSVMSAEMALEFVDPDLAQRVRLCGGPLVEGLVVASVTASTGASLDKVDSEARRALEAKGEHLTS